MWVRRPAARPCLPGAEDAAHKGGQQNAKGYREEIEADQGLGNSAHTYLPPVKCKPPGGEAGQQRIFYKIHVAARFVKRGAG